MLKELGKAFLREVKTLELCIPRFTETLMS